MSSGDATWLQIPFKMKIQSKHFYMVPGYFYDHLLLANLPELCPNTYPTSIVCPNTYSKRQGKKVFAVATLFLKNCLSPLVKAALICYFSKGSEDNIVSTFKLLACSICKFEGKKALYFAFCSF